MNPGSQSPAPSEASNSSSAATMAESRIKDILKEVYFLIHQVQVSLLSNSPEGCQPIPIFLVNSYILGPNPILLSTSYIPINSPIF